MSSTLFWEKLVSLMSVEARMSRTQMRDMMDSQLIFMPFTWRWWWAILRCSCCCNFFKKKMINFHFGFLQNMSGQIEDCFLLGVPQYHLCDYQIIITFVAMRVHDHCIRRIIIVIVVASLIYNIYIYIYTLHYITLHYITLHYITLHYITYHTIPLHTIPYIHYIYTYIYVYTCVYIHSVYIHSVYIYT